MRADTTNFDNNLSSAEDTVQKALERLDENSGSGAPIGATYITQTLNGTLSDEQALASLSTGLMKVTTGTGVVSSITDGSTNWDTAYSHSQTATGNPHSLDYIDIGLSANQVINWTAASAGTIHASNYVDNNTVYSAGTGMSLVGTVFSCTITDTNTTYTAGTGMSLDGTTFHCSITDTDTQLSDEQVQDKVGAMFSSNTETLITLTYQDGDGTIDAVVDNDLSHYSNAISGFLTSESDPAVATHESTYNHANYNTAYGWGNHTGLYELVNSNDFDVDRLNGDTVDDNYIDDAIIVSTIARDSELPTASSLSVDDVITLTGVSEGVTHLGAFTGSTIDDSLTIKAAFQDLETTIEALPGGHDAATLASGVHALTLSTQEIGVHANVEVLADFVDPDADRLWYWNDTAGAFQGLDYSGWDTTAYTGGDFLTLTGHDFDVDTAAVTNGDTTHLSSADAIFDFCETTQNYLKTSENDDSADDVSLADVQSATTNDFHNIGGTDDDVQEAADYDAVFTGGSGFMKKTGAETYTLDTSTYLTTEVDGSTTNEIEVVDEAFTSGNFDGDTTAGVSQDDFYDVLHAIDTDDDGDIDTIDATLWATKQPADADLTTYAGITPSANVQSLMGAATYAAMRTLLDLEAGTDFNAYDADIADLADGTLTGTKVSSASDSAVGVVELATVAETDTGTDTGRALTPDGLAGSNYGERPIQIPCFDWAVDVATGDAVYYFEIPETMDGMNIVSAHARVITAGTTGTTDIQVRNVTDSVDLFSTKLTIDSGETVSNTAATAYVINTSNDDVSSYDLWAVDVDAISTTAPKGLILTLIGRKP